MARHDNTTRYDTIRYWGCEQTRYASQAHETGWGHAYDTHVMHYQSRTIRTARMPQHGGTAQRTDRHATRHCTHTHSNSQTVSKSHGKRQNVSGTRKKRPGGGANWIRFPFGGQGENVGCSRQLIYI